MAFDQKMPIPVRIIARRQGPSEAKPPWEGMTFVYRIGSDDLSDQLRNVYPHLQSLLPSSIAEQLKESGVDASARQHKGVIAEG